EIEEEIPRRTGRDAGAGRLDRRSAVATALCRRAGATPRQNEAVTARVSYNSRFSSARIPAARFFSEAPPGNRGRDPAKNRSRRRCRKPRPSQRCSHGALSPCRGNASTERGGYSTSQLQFAI